MKLTLAKRAAILMTDLGLDQAGLAKYAEITRGAVNQWTSAGPEATMKPAVAYRIADKSNYEPRWLMLGEGQKYKTIGPDAALILSALPLVSDDMRESWLDAAKKALARGAETSKVA